MTFEPTRRMLWVVAVSALVVAVLLGGVASSMQASAAVANQADVVGHAAFAYLGGLRTFAAAVLWNRLEPQFHEYYEGKDMAQMTFALPTIRLVQMLDPQFQDAYYVGAWVVARHGDWDEGIRIAYDGLEANPRAGLMYANVINVLLADGLRKGNTKLHVADELELAKAGLGADVQWNSPSDQFESYVVFADTLKRAGLTSDYDRVQALLQQMRDSGVVPNMERELQEEGN